MAADDPDPQGQAQPAISGTRAAFLGLCPRCGSRTLFDGVANFAPKCRVCGLDFSRFNVGDGPAAFLTMIIGALILILALWLEFSVHPPFWVHAIIWIPVTAGAVTYGLRVSKAWLLQAEYWRKAKEAGSSDVGKGKH